MGINQPADITILHLIAEKEIKQQFPQYNTTPIPIDIIRQTIAKYQNLTPKQLQEKINAYFNNVKQEKDGIALFGLELSEQNKTKQNSDATLSLHPNGSDYEIRQFAFALMENSLLQAKSNLNTYRTNFGYISYDAARNGLNNIGDWTYDAITGRDDFKGYNEKEQDIELQLNNLQNLKDLIFTKNEFEAKFEKITGIKFDIQAFLELQQACNEKKTLSTYEYIEQYSKNCIERLYNINTLDQIQATAILNPLFGGNQKATFNYVCELNKNCTNDGELKQKLIKQLTKTHKETCKRIEEITSKTPHEILDANYKTAYKKAFGEYNPSDSTNEFVEGAQQGAEYLEMLATVGLSSTLMTSKLATKLSIKTATKLGNKAGQHVIKATMTSITAALPATETTLSALTREKDFLPETLTQIGEELKSGMIFSTFGAYVSGPLGNTLVKYLKANPNITSNIMRRGINLAGTGSEIAADSFLEICIQGGELENIIVQNAEGESLGKFIHIILGGGKANQVAKATLKNLSVKQELDAKGNTIYAVTQNGNIIYRTNEPEQFIAGLFGYVAKTDDIKALALDNKPTDINSKIITEQDFITKYNSNSNIYNSYLKEPEFFTQLKTMKMNDSNGNNIERFSDMDITYLIQKRQNNNDNIELINKLLEHPSFNHHSMYDILKLSKTKSPEYIEKLLSLSDKYRFSTECIDLLCTPNNSKLNAEQTENFLTNLDNIFNQIPELGKREEFKISHIKKSGELYVLEIMPNRKRLNDEELIIDNTGKILAFGNSTQKYNLETGSIVTSENMNLAFNNELQLHFFEAKISGEYNIYETGPDGRKNLVGLAEVNENGQRYIEKTLTSLDGTKTKTFYSDDPIGNRSSRYEIIDSDGNLLFQKTETFKVLNENHFISTINNHSFDIKLEKDKIIVTHLNENKEVETFEFLIKDVKEATTGEKLLKELNKLINEQDLSGTSETKSIDEIKRKAIQAYQNKKFEIDYDLVPTLKNLSGIEWLYLSNGPSKFIATNLDPLEISSRLYGLKFKDKTAAEISIATTSGQNLFSIEHELGHNKSAQINLWDDNELIQIYNNELKLIQTTLPTGYSNKIEYFFPREKIEINYGLNRGLEEIVAETNAIVNSIQPIVEIKQRTPILQRFFPKTIAYIANKIQSP